MNFVEFVASNSPITNVVELFGCTHSNPLGIAPAWQLVFITAVVLVMEFFLHQIRWRQKPQYYPVMFTLLGVAIVALYYYCFQGGFTMRDGHAWICWFCNSDIVGWGWAVTGIVLSIVVLYILLCAIQQTCAQLQMYSDPELVKSKPWKEWKMGVGVAMLSVILTTVGMWISKTAVSWMYLSGLLVLVLFVIGKVIADCVRTKKVLWSIAIGLVFLLGIIPIVTISTECVWCAYAYIIAIIALFTGSKARKKAPKK